MTVPPVRIVLDANVLFPFTLRDTLLRGAAAGYYQIFWSLQILEETSRNLIRQGQMTEHQAAHLLAVMQEAFPEAMVSGYEPLIDQMPNQEKDRHVAAVGMAATAQIIVTNNLKDFKVLPDGIEAQSPDQFLLNLFALAPLPLIEILHDQAAALKQPPVTFDALLVGLSKSVPRFVQAVRARLANQI